MPSTSASMGATTGLPVCRAIPVILRSTRAHCCAHTPVYPLIFHSIPEEIPDASQPLVLRLYQLWLLLVAVLVVNMAACIVMLASGVSGGGSDLGSGIGYVYCSLQRVRLLMSPQIPDHHTTVGLPVVVPVIITLDCASCDVTH